MNRDDIVREVDRNAGLSIRESEHAMDAFIQVVTNCLIAGDKAQILGFGTFEVKNRAPRMGRNPKANTPVYIPAKRAPFFKAGSKLKAAIEGCK